MATEVSSPPEYASTIFIAFRTITFALRMPWRGIELRATARFPPRAGGQTMRMAPDRMRRATTRRASVEPRPEPSNSSSRVRLPSIRRSSARSRSPSRCRAISSARGARIGKPLERADVGGEHAGQQRARRLDDLDDPGRRRLVPLHQGRLDGGHRPRQIARVHRGARLVDALRGPLTPGGDADLGAAARGPSRPEPDPNRRPGACCSTGSASGAAGSRRRGVGSRSRTIDSARAAGMGDVSVTRRSRATSISAVSIGLRIGRGRASSVALVIPVLSSVDRPRRRTPPCAALGTIARPSSGADPSRDFIATDFGRPQRSLEPSARRDDCFLCGTRSEATLAP